MKHLLVKLKDRVRKRKNLYKSYDQEKKLKRITQRVIYKLYLKYYNHPDNDVFIANALNWKPDIFDEPWCKYYLCKYEINVFRSHFRRNSFAKRRLWPDVQCGKDLLSLKISDHELMEKLKIMEDECAI